MSDKQLVSKKRIPWLDQVKAISMYLVVLGHAVLPVNKKGLFKIIYSFHMPLFFMLSGFVFNPDKYERIFDCVKDKLIKIAYPYVMLNLLCIPLWMMNVDSGMVAKDSLLKVIIGIFYSNAKVVRAPSNATWFLMTLLLSEVIYYVIWKFFKEDRQVFIMSSILLVLGVISPMGQEVLNAPFHLGVSFVAQFYFGCGYMIKKHFAYVEQFFKENRVLKMAGLALGGLFFAMINKQLDMSNENYRDIIYTLISSLSLSVFVIYLIRFSGIKSKLFSYIGKNTIIILALHIPVLRVLQASFPIFLSSIPYAILASLIIYMLCIPIVWIVKKCFPFVLKMPKAMQNLILSIKL